jgi:hypothetical protein
MSYKKYLKYKNKYLNLKYMIGGKDSCYGMTVIQERISDDFIRELHTIIEKFNHFVELKNANISYLNLYQKNLDIREYDYLLNYIKKIDMINEALKKYKILYYGFIIAKSNNKNQYFHLDYTGKTITYFIPLVNLTDMNGTEYLCFYNIENYKTYFKLFLGISRKYITRQEVIDYLITQNIHLNIDYEFRILNCKAYSVILLQHHVFHRGKTNETPHDRIMFQLTLELENVPFIKNEQFITVAENDDI